MANALSVWKIPAGVPSHRGGLSVIPENTKLNAPVFDSEIKRMYQTAITASH